MKEITADAVMESIDLITDRINEELEALDCPGKPRAQIDVAIDEILSNIIRYAYPREPGSVTVRYDCEDGIFSISFEDEGAQYNPLKKQDPDISLSAEERKIGGLGIFLVKKTMDAVEYRHQDGRNILTIRKRILNQAPPISCNTYEQ